MIVHQSLAYHLKIEWVARTQTAMVIQTLTTVGPSLKVLTLIQMMPHNGKTVMMMVTVTTSLVQRPMHVLCNQELLLPTDTVVLIPMQMAGPLLTFSGPL